MILYFINLSLELLGLLKKSYKIVLLPCFMLNVYYQGYINYYLLEVDKNNYISLFNFSRGVSVRLAPHRPFMFLLTREDPDFLPSTLFFPLCHFPLHLFMAAATPAFNFTFFSTNLHLLEIPFRIDIKRFSIQSEAFNYLLFLIEEV